MAIAAAIYLAVIAQTDSSGATSGNPFLLFTVGITWAALWIQLMVLPFYGKAESLHKDYSATGRINIALGAIEADELIPALSRMFIRVREAQPDKRKRLEHEIEAVLQSVEFLPDLQSAQDAMSKMDNIRHSYRRLKHLASGLWKTGLLHSLLTPLLPTLHVLLVPIDGRWRFVLLFVSALWLLTLTFCVWRFFQLHTQLDRFTTALEAESVD